jgi:rhamnulokinase
VGIDCAYTTLIDEAARSTDYAARIDPEWPGFTFHENMLDSIRIFMRETAQQEPRQPGEFTRAILLGLAESYAKALDELRALTNKQLARLVVLGGGAQNELLNEFTASRAHVVVSRGAIEAAILGNVQNQLLAIRGVKERSAASP